MNDLDTGSKDRYGIFHAYNEKLKTADDAKKEWLFIKQTFMMLEEWYEDRNLYHIIGFLIYCGVDIAYICKLSQHATKSTFEYKLRKKCICLCLWQWRSWLFLISWWASFIYQWISQRFGIWSRFGKNPLEHAAVQPRHSTGQPTF